MTNSYLLETMMRKNKISRDDLATALCLSLDDLDKKIKGLEEFNTNEISILKNTLKLSQSERNEIFFKEASSYYLISQFLYLYMKKLNYSKKDISRITGLSPYMVTKILKNEGELRITPFIHFCRGLNVSADDFMI